MNNQQRVLAELQKQDGKTINVIHKATGLTVFQVNAAIAGLKVSELVFEKAGRWYLTDDGGEAA